MSSRLLLVLLVAILIRLSPTAITDQPFSTDVWPLTRLCGTLLSNPDYRVWDHLVLGGYHNRWPAVLLEGTFYARVTGLSAEAFFRYVGVVATATVSILALYSLAKRLWGTSSATLSSLALASVPSLAIFTSATLKEVYAYPLALTILHLLTRRPTSWGLTAVALLSLALSTSHPLTPLILIASVASYTYVTYVKLVQGSQTSLSSVRPLLKPLAVLSLTYALYTALYSAGGLPYRLDLGDYVNLVLIATAVYGWYTLVGGSIAKSAPLIALAVGAISISAGYRTLGEPWLYVYVAPLALSLPIALRLNPLESSLVTSVLLPVSVGALYVVTALPTLTTIVYRILNYLSFTVALVVGFLATRRSALRAYAVVAISLVSCVVAVLSTIAGANPLTYYWTYSEREVTGILEHVARLATGGICGDAKVAYLASYVIDVDTVCGLKLLKGFDTGRPTVLYWGNLRLGYVLSPLDTYRGVDLGELLRGRSLLYANGDVYLVR